jgi:hypothetical protein
MDELLIGRNLDWVEDGGIFREDKLTKELQVKPVRKISYKKRR